jgi:hypothetical protein
MICDWQYKLGDRVYSKVARHLHPTRYHRTGTISGLGSPDREGEWYAVRWDNDPLTGKAVCSRAPISARLLGPIKDLPNGGILMAVPTAQLADWMPDWAIPWYKHRPMVHHVTLEYGVIVQKHQSLIGTKFSAKLHGYAYGPKADCLLVELPPEIPYCGVQPHITLSWPAGSAPVQARRMLEDSSWVGIAEAEPALVEMVVKFQPWL